MIIRQAIPDGLLVCLASRPMLLGGLVPEIRRAEGLREAHSQSSCQWVKSFMERPAPRESGWAPPPPPRQ